MSVPYEHNKQKTILTQKESDPRGINLRNNIAHGLVRHELLNMGLANWVVHSLLLIAMLKIRPSN